MSRSDLSKEDKDRAELLETIARLEQQLEDLSSAVSVDLDVAAELMLTPDESSRIVTRYQQLVANSQDVLWSADIKGMPEAFWAIRRGEYTLDEALAASPPRVELVLSFCSPATWQIFAMSPEEKLQIPLEQSMTSESLRRVYESFRKHLGEELAGTESSARTFELDEFRSDGTIVHTEVKCQFVRDAHGVPIAVEGTTRDITSRKLVECRLERQLCYQRLLAKISSDFINVSFEQLDAAVSTALGQIAELWNAQRALVVVFGDGLNDVRCSHEWVSESADSAFQQLREVECREFTWLTTHWTEAKPLLIPDTGQMPAEAQADAKRLVACNVKALASMPMFIAGTLVGHLCFEFLRTVQVWPDDFGDQLKLVADLIANVLKRKWTEEHLHESNRQLEETLGELRATQEQVIRQERLRALGQMASGIAHDLNNSLSPTIAHGEVLFHSPELSAEARQRVAWMLTGAHDAAEVVRRLQVFYHPQFNELAKEVVKLQQLLEELPLLTKPKWRDEAWHTGREIEFRLTVKDAPPVCGVASELRQVFINLVFNAVDAMPDGGILQVHAHTHGDYVIVDLSDTGRGMTAEQRKRCFEPFFTTKTHGSGLGLSVCHGIVKMHGGRMEVDSHAGRGTRFRVFLPIARADAPVLPRPVRDLQLASHYILYIDDDERIRPSVAALMGSLGQKVDLAESGERGYALFRENRYDLVITDMAMPGMDGRQITRIVKRLRPEIPVMLITGWSEFASFDDNWPESDRPDAVLMKPITMDQLREGIQDLVRKQKPASFREPGGKSDDVSPTVGST